MAYAEKRQSEAKGSKKVTWRARYKRPDGKWDSVEGFPTKRTAEAFAEEQEAAVRAGRWIDPKLSKKPFGEWAREWMAEQAPRGNTTTRRWARLDADILPRWDAVPLDQINWFEAENWANGLECDDVSATHALSLMSSILTGAVDAKHLLVNPLFGRRRRRTAAAKVEIQAKDQTKLWVPPEQVLRGARRAGRRDGMHILTTAFTGMRWGESLGLHRDRVLGERREAWDGGEFVCPILQIREEVAEYQERNPDGKKGPIRVVLEPVKTRESNRDIDVPPFLAELLREHLESVKFGYVFCTKGGKHWRRGNFGRQVMDPVFDGREPLPASRGHAPREGWDPIMPGATMRALRHTHDTFQAQIGVAPILEHEQAGHAYPGMKGRYQHPTPEMRQVRLDGLEGIFQKAMVALGWKTVWES
ncbi:hypothetical protein [Streptacidiphilus sp. MAP5-3]|uniref:hypothetical protein n=1 Tax=unclassified Streptacidiphilus TaxID=2643834 RepID=UPI0035119C62